MGVPQLRPALPQTVQNAEPVAEVQHISQLVALEVALAYLRSSL
jgi:hypothetical protein